MREAKRRSSSPEGRETLLAEKAVEAFSDTRYIYVTVSLRGLRLAWLGSGPAPSAG